MGRDRSLIAGEQVPSLLDRRVPLTYPCHVSLTSLRDTSTTIIALVRRDVNDRTLDTMHIHSAIRRPLVAAHLLWTAFATAQFDDFYWSVNNECPGYVGFNCTAPQQACAYHGLLNKWYCCGGDDGVCWTNAIRCQSNQTQTLCGSGNDRFCCLNQYEQCSQRQSRFDPRSRWRCTDGC